MLCLLSKVLIALLFTNQKAEHGQKNSIKNRTTMVYHRIKLSQNISIESIFFATIIIIINNNCFHFIFISFSLWYIYIPFHSELWRFCVLWGLLQASPTFTKGLINSPIPVRNNSLLALPFNKPMPHFMINILFYFIRLSLF